MTDLLRRDLLRRAAATAAVFAAPSIRMGRVPSDDLRIGVVGTRGRGKTHIDQFEALDGVRVVALCDVDSVILEERAEELRATTGRSVATFVDMREMLTKGEIDAVSIATPNHLHALQTIWALSAGKDVYVEKPMSHTIWEGQQVVAAAAKYGRIVQTGTQARSSRAIQDAIAWLDSGEIGAKTHAWGTCYKPRSSIGKVSGPQPIPKTIDWKLYQGPVGETPLLRKQLHYDWHWQQATGNGDLGNQGVHQLDQARWGLGQTELPRAAISIGGRFGYDDDGDTPNTLLTFYDYQPAPMIFVVHGLPHRREGRASEALWRKSMDRRLNATIGAVIHAKEGYLIMTDNYSLARAFNPDGNEMKRWESTDDHFQNFVDAVRSGDGDAVNASAHDGHISAGLCHMGSDSLALGQQASVKQIERALATQPLLAHGFDRMLAHLELNEIDVAKTPLTLGTSLRFDSDSGLYAENEAANARMRGRYASGFEVPTIED